MTKIIRLEKISCSVTSGYRLSVVLDTAPPPRLGKNSKQTNEQTSKQTKETLVTQLGQCTAGWWAPPTFTLAGDDGVLSYRAEEGDVLQASREAVRHGHLQPGHHLTDGAERHCRASQLERRIHVQQGMLQAGRRGRRRAVLTLGPTHAAVQQHSQRLRRTKRHSAHAVDSSHYSAVQCDALCSVGQLQYRAA